MISLADVYALPVEDGLLADTRPSSWWFPELSDSIDQNILERMDEEGRFKIRAIGYDSSDGYRYALMASIWFEGHPVMVVQEAGRSGRDHQKRWVTDVMQYQNLCAYVLAMQIRFSADSNDVVSDETIFFPEELFGFYGQNFGKRFGLVPETSEPGYLLMDNKHGRVTLIPDTNPDHYIVGINAFIETPAPYIRRGPCVLKLVGQITAQELERNPLMQPDDDEYTRYFWYEESERPNDFSIVPI